MDRATDVTVEGEFAYVADLSTGMYIIDISEPASPGIVGRYKAHADTMIQDIVIRGMGAYLSNWKRGVRVVNIADPTDPERVAYYEVGYEAFELFVDDKFVYVCGGTEGLYILDFDETVDVLITSFSAHEADDGIELRWEISSDERIAGFKLLREPAAGGSGVYLPSEGLLPPSATSYIDTEFLAAGEHLYTLIVVNSDGTEVQSQKVSVTPDAVPFALRQNFPNPFNPNTVIGFSIDRESDVTLAIYDVTGKLVRTVLNRKMPIGIYSEKWDGCDERGKNVASGIYFYRLKAGKRVLTRKMVLLR